MEKKLKLFVISGLVGLMFGTSVLYKSFAKNQALQASANQPQTLIAQANSTTPPQSAMTGWLGFATTANKNGVFLPLLPVNADAQVALFSDAWDQVKPGTSLVGIAEGIKQQVKFHRSQEEPFGCENKGLPKNKLFQEKQEICFLKNDNHFKGEKRGCRGQPLFSPSSMHEKSIHLSSILKLNSVGLVCFIAK
ncbi:MAG: hypothetical protein RM049_34795 [Nostoc sp. DedQUE04]|uniref:hypothetical protein n=1 Tax=Nostoc sp. DedQUE04 TaxID=3075390 RepID=UPI002AD5381B|nr:hypothetical protein [Nostoc sp. DedQUE04]MDZ8140404.1 hypothetical protein [Nostoc sp. DedQUE04]